MIPTDVFPGAHLLLSQGVSSTNQRANISVGGALEGSQRHCLCILRGTHLETAASLMGGLGISQHFADSPPQQIFYCGAYCLFSKL